MEDKHWYCFQNKAQLGPFSTVTIIEMYHNKIITQESYLFKVGWKDWRPLEDCLKELELSTNSQQKPSSPEKIIERRKNAPRATVGGQIIVHNNSQLIKGKAANISSTGLFIETSEAIFNIGEKIKLTCKVDGLSKPFNAVAMVMRFSVHQAYPQGYGMMFEKLDPKIAKQIEGLIAKKS